MDALVLCFKVSHVIYEMIFPNVINDCYYELTIPASYLIPASNFLISMIKEQFIVINLMELCT